MSEGVEESAPEELADGAMYEMIFSFDKKASVG
jgi:hypothetical protein